MNPAMFSPVKQDPLEVALEFLEIARQVNYPGNFIRGNLIKICLP